MGIKFSFLILNCETHFILIFKLYSTKKIYISFAFIYFHSQNFQVNTPLFYFQKLIYLFSIYTVTCPVSCELSEDLNKNYILLQLLNYPQYQGVN